MTDQAKQITKSSRLVNRYFLLFLLFLFSLVILSVLLAVNLGSTEISVSDTFQVIKEHIFVRGLADKQYSAISDIVWYIRLPRLVLALCTGAALSVCGTVMQAVMRNSMADPYVAGISSGASLGATLAIFTGIGAALGEGFVGIVACIGAFGAGILVIFISNLNGRPSVTKLILTGMALSAACSAVSSFFVYMKNDAGATKTITFWLMGSLSGAKWENLVWIFPIVIVCTLFFMTRYRVLNLMLLGDSMATTLGTDLRSHRNLYIFVTSIMVGLTVYTSGMIGFVGLIIPHFARMIVGSNHKYLVATSALIGGILLLWADVLCRVIIPHTELPIGIMTSAIGAPSFLYVLIKNSRGQLS